MADIEQRIKNQEAFAKAWEDAFDPKGPDSETSEEKPLGPRRPLPVPEAGTSSPVNQRDINAHERLGEFLRVFGPGRW